MILHLPNGELEKERRQQCLMMKVKRKTWKFVDKYMKMLKKYFNFGVLKKINFTMS